MSEAEKQEGQKTVVSFITGLLIGGLLVWVFSSSPESTPTTEPEETPTEETTDAGTNTDAVTSESTTITVPKQTVTTAPVATGKGVLTVTDQTAGNVVTLGATTYPNENGWIVVRDYKDNVSGKILGASRFATKDGLTPATVNLLRPTIKGSEYQVQFYTEDGDKKFDTKTDTVVSGGEATFKAN